MARWIIALALVACSSLSVLAKGEPKKQVVIERIYLMHPVEYKLERVTINGQRKLRVKVDMTDYVTNELRVDHGNLWEVFTPDCPIPVQIPFPR